MYLRNWVRSGIKKVGDLRFINGKIGEAYLHQIIQRQTNIHSELMLVKKAWNHILTCLQMIMVCLIIVIVRQ